MGYGLQHGGTETSLRGQTPQTTVLLCRHGETEFNLRGILQGQMDSELTSAGREQAVMLGHALANKGIDQFCRTVYSSDLSRARDTARAALSAFGSKGEAFALDLDTRLRERSLGPFQGLTAAQCDQEHRAAWRTFNQRTCRAELDSAGAIGVEDDEELQARALAGETVIVVSHGGWIHAALACCAAQETVPHIGNGSICTLIFSADGRGWMKSGPENSHIRVGAAKENADIIGICGTVRSGK